jgi:hypothetical protein
MTAAKKPIDLTDDNWHDYLRMGYLEKLVAEFPVGAEGYDVDDQIVTRLLAWVALQSGQSTEYRYKMSRHDAAVVLNLTAGWDATTGVSGK